MKNLNLTYPSNSNAPDGSYPYGSARNITTSGDNTGTPFKADLQNDIIGLQQFLLNEAAISPNNSSDTAVSCQQFEAMWAILNARTETHNITVDSDYTLTATQNLKQRYNITDTGVVLTTSRNIIVDNVQRFFYAKNSTAQDLVFKTSAGTGITVSPNSELKLYCDGTNVIVVDSGILQILQATTTTQVINNTSTYISTGLSAVITPATTNSRVIIDSTLPFTYGANIGNIYVGVRLMRGGTPIYNSTIGLSIGIDTQVTTSNNICYIDSPNSTSPVTYTIEFNEISSINRNGNTTFCAGVNTGTMTLLEAGA
jgi:hypothetical protein